METFISMALALKILVILFVTKNHSYVKSESIQSNESCFCTSISNSAQIKCQLETKYADNPQCTAVFQQADNDFSLSHTKCRSQNTFSTFGLYSGQLRKINVFCTANYPMDIDFDGMLPHQSIGVSFYRRDKINHNNNESLSISTLVLSMDVEPDITGKYTIFGRHNRSFQTFLYIFAESDNTIPNFMFNGQTLHALINEDIIILPCRLLNPNYKVSLRRNFDKQVVQQNAKYDAKIGFIFNRQETDLQKLSGEYECFINNNPNAGNVFVNVSPKVLEPEPKLYKDKRLSLNVTGKWVSCSSDRRDSKDYRLVNMRARNPSESRMKKRCFLGETECIGKREGSFSHCYSSQKYCKTVDFKEGGGIISCFFRNASTFSEPNDYLLGLDGKTYVNPDVKSVPIEALIQIKANGHSGNDFYSGVTYTFSCNAVSYLLTQPMRWYFKFINGSFIPVDILDSDDYSKSKEIYDISSKNIVYNNYKIETIVKLNNSDVVGISCGGFAWNSEEKINHTFPIFVEESAEPSFVENNVPVQFVRGQTNYLECDVQAKPNPEIEWRKGNEKVLGTGSSNRTLYISNVTENDKGIYACIATNALGRSSKFFSVTVVEPSTGPGYFVTVGIPLLVIFVCVLISAFLIHHYKNARKGLSKEEIEEFLKGVNRNGKNFNTLNITDPNEYESYMSTIPYPKNYEIVDGKFHIDEESLLGSGAFGMVYKGSIEGKSIAIKTLKRNADLYYLRALLTELKVMIHLKEHPNIVNLVGANTKHLNRGAIYVMVELCSLGSMESYLRKNRIGFEDKLGTETDYTNSPIKKPILNEVGNFDQVSVEQLSSVDLITWSYQIANGMEYLSSRNVIHGDLAVRNILLYDKSNAKISDFGLSRKMYEFSNYVKNSQEPLPWRHMALESLRDLSFSTNSDVWAYGITIWEIFSLGEVPYPGLSWTASFVQDIEDGLRMKQSKYSSHIIYEMQLQCWMNDPQERPSFTVIKDFFAELMNQLKSNQMQAMG